MNLFSSLPWALKSAFLSLFCLFVLGGFGSQVSVEMKKLLPSSFLGLSVGERRH